MTMGRLAIGSRVISPDGEPHHVTALRSDSTGVTLIHLRAADLTSTCLIDASELFRTWVIDRTTPISMIPSPGLIDAVPKPQRKEVLAKIAHLREVIDGTRRDGTDGPPLPHYDPDLTTEAQRFEAKAAELTTAGTKVSARTLRRWRDAYVAEGAPGLVKKPAMRAKDPLADADPRVISALRAEIALLDTGSTISRSTLIAKAAKRLRAEGLQMPPRTTAFRYLGILTEGTYTFGEATTRRSNHYPDGTFTETRAGRPGEWVQADTTPLDVLAIYEDGSVGAVELTILADIATRSIVAWRITPESTSSVDVSSLLAQCLSPEPMREGWAEHVRATHPSSPLAGLVDEDERLATAAARPIIKPETLAVDRGKAYLSKSTKMAAANLDISVQPSRVYTGSDKAVVERTFGSIRTMFSEFLAGYKGRNTAHRGKHPEHDAALRLDELDELFGWWVIAYWQRRAHEGLRHPLTPERALTPNQAYAAGLQICGYIEVSPL